MKMLLQNLEPMNNVDGAGNNAGQAGWMDCGAYHHQLDDLLRADSLDSVLKIQHRLSQTVHDGLSLSGDTLTL